MSVARPEGGVWLLDAPEPVGDARTLVARLLGRADGGAVALGVDLPLGLPRAYVARHRGEANFLAFLDGLRGSEPLFDVCATLEEVGPERPFYPSVGLAGMTRAAHAAALDLASWRDLGRVCDRATAERPAGAMLFWTLGPNQSGKAALHAWRTVVLPARAAGVLRLWPFEGAFRTLLMPGEVAMAETYPAEALRQLGLRPVGSKRRQADRQALAAGLRAAAERLGVRPSAAAAAALNAGCGSDAAGEDRWDSMLGVLGVIGVLRGVRPDTAPDDAWIRRWEGWVLGQHPPVPLAAGQGGTRPSSPGA